MSANIDNSAESNPAVARCCEAYRNACRAQLENVGTDDYDYDEKVIDAQNSGEQAYVDAMPPLLGVRNIRNFIACAAHGSAKGMLDGKDATRLLYAAQVAFSTRRIRPSRKETASSSSKHAKKTASRAISEPVSAIQEPFLSPAAVTEAPSVQ